jgi:FtsH-binding integral membrane protein
MKLPDRSTLSFLGASLCLFAIFLGLPLSAVVTSWAKNEFAQAALFIAGVMGTFGLVWLATRLDYALRRFWYRRFSNDAPERQKDDEDSAKTPVDDNEKTFFKMLFSQLIIMTGFYLLFSLVLSGLSKILGDWTGTFLMVCIVLLFLVVRRR